MNKLFEDIISEITSGEKFPNTDYISTGYESINLLLGGFQPGKLIVIGGRPAMGKTTLAINMMMKEVMQQIPVAYFSLDASEREIALKMISQSGNIPFSILNNLSESNVQNQVLNCILDLKDASFYVECNPLFNIHSLKERIKESVIDGGVKIVYIDTLQLLAYNEERMDLDTFGEVCIQLKKLAIELNIPIVLLSSLNRQPENREGLDGKIPQIGDLYGSSKIEELADIILMIYRPAYYQIYEDIDGKDLRNTTYLYVLKHKNGPLGVVDMKFYSDCLVFTSFLDNCK